MRAVVWIVLIAAYCDASGAPQNPPASDATEAEAELARHQGTWQVMSFVHNGQAADPDVMASIRRVVAGKHVTWTRAGKSFSGSSMEIDASKQPAHLDLIPDGGPFRDQRVLGIYRWDDGELWICMANPGQPRPDRFEAGVDSQCTLMRLRKQ